MAKKAYVGVNNIARKVKNGYVGVRTAFPIYETQTTTEKVNIVGSNIGLYFGTRFDYFGWSDTRFKSNNKGVVNSTSLAILTALQDCTVTYTYNYGTEQNYDKFSLTVKGTTIHNNVSGVGTARTRTDTLTKGQTIVFKYTKDGSVDSNGDYFEFYNMSATVTTTKEVQVGTDYRDVARKIKKAYVGVGGIAKLCWGQTLPKGVIKKLGGLPNNLYGLGTTPACMSDVAYVHGWSTASTYTNSLTSIDSNLAVANNRVVLSSSVYGLAGCSFEDYAIFSGGCNSSGNVLSERTAINKAGTKTNVSMNYSRYKHSSVAINNEAALFAGGYRAASSNTTNLVEGISYDLTHTATINSLDNATALLAGATTGSHFVFFGGNHVSYSSYEKFQVYNQDLTKLSSVRSPYNVSVGITSLSYISKALFAGGTQPDLTSSPIESGIILVVTDNLTVSTVSGPTVRDAAAAKLGNYALIAGGQTNWDSSDYSVQGDIYVFDENMTQQPHQSLGYSKFGLSGVTVGNYVIFTGGAAHSINDDEDYYNSAQTWNDIFTIEY